MDLGKMKELRRLVDTPGFHLYLCGNVVMCLHSVPDFQKSSQPTRFCNRHLHHISSTSSSTTEDTMVDGVPDPSSFRLSAKRALKLTKSKGKDEGEIHVVESWCITDIICSHRH